MNTVRISIKSIQELSINILLKYGVLEEEAELIIENFLEGELTGKRTHGLVRLPWLVQLFKKGEVKISPEKIKIIKETPVSLLINGMGKTGFYVINKALQLGISKVKQSGLVTVGVTNIGPASGLIGLYARKATEENLIFIGFNGSPGGLVPHGSIENLWGTNPITIGIPSPKIPFILDMASSQITWGHLLLAQESREKLPKGVAIDENGRFTTDPYKAMQGGLLPIAGHKGSGLAMATTLLAGPLIESENWGSLMVLIDPTILTETNKFKKKVQSVIYKLKNSKRCEGIKEIYYPGEKSYLTRQQNIQNGYIEIPKSLWQTLNNLNS